MARTEGSGRQGPDALVSDALASLSGHVAPGASHTYYLPQDLDHDGLIDHVLVHCESGLNAAACEGLRALSRLWDGSKGEWFVRLVQLGQREGFLEDPYLASGRKWRSVTPYCHPWYRKPGFGASSQIVRESTSRGWPAPRPRRLKAISAGGRSLGPSDFVLTRRKREVRQPDSDGSFWRLEFPRSIAGPVTLGFARYWGLGLFTADLSPEAE